MAALPSPEAQRLEDVRERLGFSSVRGFWRCLKERGDLGVSYDAARRYHLGERRVPAAYFAAISEVFDEIRLEYLLSGEAPMTKQALAVERVARDRLEEMLADHPMLRKLDRVTQELFLEVYIDYLLQRSHPWPETEEAVLYQRKLVGDLVFLVFLPFGAWGFRDLEELDRHELRAYVRSVLPALDIALKPPQKGDSVGDHPTSLIPTLRRAANGQPLEPSEESQALAETVSIQAQQRLRERDEKLTEIFDRQERLAVENARKGQHILPYAEDLPPVEPVKPLSGSDLIACDYCDAKVRGDEYREHVESEHPERVRRLGEGQFVD